VPLVLTGFLAYCTAGLVLAVYDSTIEVILLCFCEDYREFVEKDNGRKSHMAFMGPKLRTLVLGDGVSTMTQGEIEQMIKRGLTIEEAKSLHEANRNGEGDLWEENFARTGRGVLGDVNGDGMDDRKRVKSQQDLFDDEAMKGKMESKLAMRKARSAKRLEHMDMMRKASKAFRK
jgi:hypothetical protein